MAEKTNIKIESPGVNVAIIKKDYDGWKILILKRAETESYGGFWGFLTGGKEGDETVAQVVKREMKEEINVLPKSTWATEYLVQFYEPEYDSIWILPVIVAVIDNDDKIELSPENSDFRWAELSKAKFLLSWKNQIQVTEMISEELEIFPCRKWVEIFS
ncbi:MAG: NUDIX domain-containing protein [candidate division Zixibacteria bacterium]|nr:NUDIX domain-containing protein [candidate division Zixibacteria bacterium]